MQVRSRPTRRGRAWSLWLATAALLAAAQTFAEPPTLNEVADRYRSVAALQQRVQQMGHDTTYEFVSLHTVSLFLDFVQWDKANPDKVTQRLEKYRRKFPVDIAGYARDLPGIQLADCMVLLDDAEASLEALANGTLQRRTPPQRDGSKMRFDGPHVVMDGRPVFPSTFIWMPHTPENERAFGAFHNAYTTALYLKPDLSSNRPDGGVLSGNQIEPNDTRFRTGLFIGHNRPVWMEERHPEMIQGERHFTRYDIDNPGVRDIVSSMLDRAIPDALPTNDHNLYLLANEPHFSTAVGRWMASEMSEHTHAGFRVWLKSHYGSIDKLNASWAASHQSFDAIRIELPIDPELQGGAQWYDWCRYNMDRVNDWFAFLKDKVREHDPEALTTIKKIGHLLSRPHRDHGIDIETLIRMQEVPGLDPGTAPAFDDLIYWKFRRDEVRHPYAIDWRAQSATLDIIKSIAPDRPVYNSEWHGFGTAKWISTKMSADYVRAGFWLEFLHGDSMINAWFWGRNADGSMKDSVLNGPLTQPIAVAAFGRVMHELNAFAPEVAALSQAPKRAFVFYAEDAAISSEAYARGVMTTHEALTLAGAIVGFVTPTMLRDDPDAYPLVVVPEASHISDQSLAALREADTARVLIGTGHFRLNERGQPRDPAGDLFGVAVAERLESATPADLAKQLRPILAQAGVLAPVTVADAASGALPVGVLARSVAVDDGWLVALVNTAKAEHAVNLTGPDGIALDVATVDDHGPFDGSLPPLAVRLLKAKAQPEAVAQTTSPTR
ncbi:MAG: alpha-amylase family protein [Planctomycetota bacterium]